MAETTRQDQPLQPSGAPAKQPAVIDLEQIETMGGLDSLTEANVKFEAPKAREARERREIATQEHKQRIDLVKLVFAGILLLGILAVAVDLVVLKPTPTESQRTLGSTLLTTLLGGVIGYAFGKLEGGKSDKE